MTAVQKLLQRYLEHVSSERNLSAHTVRAYRGDLATFLDFLAAHFLSKRPEDVRPGDVDALAVRSFLSPG